MSKAGEFIPMHLLASVFRESVFDPGFLSGAMRYRNDHFVGYFFKTIANKNRPGKELLSLDKALQALVRDVEPLFQIPCGQSRNFAQTSWLRPSAVA